MAGIRRGLAIWGLLALLLGAQIVCAHILRPLRPAIDEMPFPLGELGIKGLAFGDDQFLFRFLARWLQDVGDGGGRVRPLKDYDYDRVVAWLQVLDRLDGRSDYGFVLASNYFGALMEPVAGPPRVRKIALYLRERALADPPRHWPGLVWAAEHARRAIKDPDLCRQLAGDLVAIAADDQVPRWLPLLASSLYRFSGDVGEAEKLERDPQLSGLRQTMMRDLLEKLRASDNHQP